jgi:hypothetical protein
LPSDKSLISSSLGMVVHVCNPSYLRGGGRRITVHGWPQGKVIDYLKYKLTQKGLELLFKW